MSLRDFFIAKYQENSSSYKLAQVNDCWDVQCYLLSLVHASISHTINVLLDSYLTIFDYWHSHIISTSCLCHVVHIEVIVVISYEDNSINYSIYFGCFPKVLWQNWSTKKAQKKLDLRSIYFYMYSLSVLGCHWILIVYFFAEELCGKYGWILPCLLSVTGISHKYILMTLSLSIHSEHKRNIILYARAWKWF